ncbi:MAG: hypothetical protein P4L56_28065 [Candidatus Sulfopaludibacter sp.]|nr:hypothetical protein [Candidatus Sulfopaludibacter sp.]
MPDSARRLPARPSLEQLQKQAKDLLRQYRADSATATLAEAQLVLAREYGFATWARLKHHVEAIAQPKTITLREPQSQQDWETLYARMGQHQIPGLNASAINLTDDEMLHLERIPHLRELDISGWKGQITDRGLAVLRLLPELRRLQMCWQQNVTDAGMAHLSRCDHLEDVNLMGTQSGDGAIRALAGKPTLRRFKTGQNVSDEGLALLHQFPAFKTWQGGEIRCELMSADGFPTQLLVDGPFTNAGLAKLAGLNGLFALGFFWHCRAFTSDGLDVLRHPSNLGLLACQGERCDDDAMRRIAAVPRLRMLMGQGTVASDAGFEALSRSQSLEYIWGRECPHLTGRGFTALASMPSLRGLAVSCKNVDDDALSTLPRFPALRELLPMDVSDEGFRHIGRCEKLDTLWCMYCRDTGDRATAHVAGLARLKSYYAGKTQITDRSLETLARIDALERLEF